jgi:hypothetical protein
MDSKHQDIARRCLEGAESGTMTFPETVSTLTAGAFDGYLVDLRLSKAIYYLQDGRGLDLPTQLSSVAVATQFNVDVVETAIREAQALVPGYSYKRFLRQGKARGMRRISGLLLGPPRILPWEPARSQPVSAIGNGMGSSIAARRNKRSTSTAADK